MFIKTPIRFVGKIHFRQSEDQSNHKKPRFDLNNPDQFKKYFQFNGGTSSTKNQYFYQRCEFEKHPKFN